ncbi:MAG: cation-transporting P-type ATPase [Betaproteobacteria bacterium]|nr:cation-transporting P-type ATPase [Betaproteobacteria bacterium]
MKINQLTVDEATASLRSSRAGLSAAQATRRLAEYGLNRIEKAEREPLALRFAREFTHFFALILWLAAALAYAAELREPGGGMAALAAAIVGVIVVNGVFSFWQEYRAERAIYELAKLLPSRCAALRDGAATEIAAEKLVPGDVILLKEGDEIPADCRVIESFGLRVNTATVTGESVAIEKTVMPDGEEDLLRARNVVLAGTLVVAGSAQALVFATGMRTEFGKIAHLTQSAAEPLSPLQREITRLSRLVAVLATVLGVLFFLLGQALGFPFWDNFIFAIGVIVANVPEGLLPTVTLALAMATQRMGRRNALVRHLPAVETLGAATVIVTDKTGTLTQNRMEARRLYFAEGPQDCGALHGGRDPAGRERRFLEVAFYCHDLRELIADGKRRWRGDPMEEALRRLAAPVMAARTDYVRRDEIAFDSDRKRLSTVYVTPQGPVLYCKGALETVLPTCSSVATADGAVPLSEALRSRFIAAETEFAHEGMRVIALGCRELPRGSSREQWEQDLTLLGLVGLADPVRLEVPQAIATCRAAGIRVIMVTGDHPQTALAVARQIGLVRTGRPLVVSGERLQRMTGVQLQLALDADEIIFARVGANQKMVIVEALQRKGEIVAVTGDGVNDAPALKRADIGIAMGLAGTDVAKESADMVLLDDNFASIVAAIEEGRAVYDNIRKFMTYILTSNVPELVPYLAFVLARIPLPLTIMQILAVDLGTDMVPALALGAEEPAPGGMQRPPRPRGERLLTWGLVARAYLFLGALEALAAMAAFFFMLDAAGWRYGAPLAHDDPVYLQATTACLAAIVMMQVVNVFLCRHPVESAFRFGLVSNRLIAWGIAFELALLALIVYTPPGNRIFGTAPIALEAWLFVVPFALGMLALEEARKLVARRLRRDRAQAR